MTSAQEPAADPPGPSLPTTPKHIYVTYKYTFIHTYNTCVYIRDRVHRVRAVKSAGRVGERDRRTAGRPRGRYIQATSKSFPSKPLLMYHYGFRLVYAHIRSDTSWCTITRPRSRLVQGSIIPMWRTAMTAIRGEGVSRDLRGRAARGRFVARKIYITLWFGMHRASPPNTSATLCARSESVASSS